MGDASSRDGQRVNNLYVMNILLAIAWVAAGQMVS